MNELKLPELGENIESVDISAVLVAVGDTIRRDQPVIEVETEKASLEVPSEFEGRVQEILVRQGDKIKVGQVILVVDSSAQAAVAAPRVAAPKVEAAKPDEAAKLDEPAREVAEPSRAAAPPTEVASVVNFAAKPRRTKPEIGEPVPAAPSVRALAREIGVDLREVAGSGPAGRITRDDVKAHAKALLGRVAGRGGGGPAVTPAALPDPAAFGPIEREPLSKVRRLTAEVMAHAWATVPHVTQFDRADVTQLEAMRRSFNQRPDAAGHKLTLTAIVVKMAARALRQFPKFNASLDLAESAVIYKRYVHIGVAVDTERGLLVPVVRDADRAGLLQISAQIDDLAERARARKIRPEEMRGGSFTISNLGGLGTTYFSPIVNWPEVAILGVGRAEVQAVQVAERFEPRLLLPLSLSYDHRLIDGAEAARFLRWLAEALEQPLLLLIDEPAP